MNKKAVIFTSIILFSGILSVNGLATGHSKDNFFKFPPKEKNFTWRIHSDHSVFAVEVTTPEAIEVINGSNISPNEKNVSIVLKTDKDISEGIYTVTATLQRKNMMSITYTVPVIIGMATDSQVKNSLNKEVSNLESDITSIRGRIDETENDMEDLKVNISNVKSSGSKRKSKLSSLDNNLTELTAKLENLKTKLNKYEKKLEKAQTTTSTGMVFTSASLGIGIVLIVLVLYLGLKKGLFKKLIQTSQQTYKEKIQKKEPWER